MAVAAAVFSVLLLFQHSSSAASPSPYLSPTTLDHNYHSMLSNFKVFIYPSSKPFQSPPASLFYNSLIKSSFRTKDPTRSDLFFFPFPPDTSTRSLARLVRKIRNSYPYWNRTLGADHFFISLSGIDYSSDRNILELKKNSIQISPFPVVSGKFIPHKDITFPPFDPSPLELGQNSFSSSFLGYLRWDGITEPDLVKELKSDRDFLVEEMDSPKSVERSKFCLFLYNGEAVGMARAMASGCVAVVIVDRPIQDLPLMDVLRWSDLGLVVTARRGLGRVKAVLKGVSEEKYREMRELGMVASRHLVWNDEAEPLDAFHMVMYQLWLRRHVIRYARREFV